MADAQPASAAKRQSMRPLLLIALIALAPVVASVVVYFFYPRTAQLNYGRLLPVAPVADLAGARLDGTPFRISELQGRWVLVVAAPGECDAGCRRELYATRQARTIQGRQQDRVVRLWLVTDAFAPAPALLDEHPGLVVARVDRGALAGLPAGDRAIYLVDPRGNLVLQYPEDPDIKALAKDLSRLLTASSIG